VGERGSGKIGTSAAKAALICSTNVVAEATTYKDSGFDVHILKMVRRLGAYRGK
jgi:hypothetical protein